MKEILYPLIQQKLETSIDTLRDILSEMCCIIDEYKVNMEKLSFKLTVR